MKRYLYGQNIFAYIQHGANHGFVNCAYTSQIDSKTGILKGKCVGDKFYRENGNVLQADHNAALNILARLNKKFC